MRIKTQDVLDTARLVNDLAQGYFTYSALMTIAKDVRAEKFIPEVLPGQTVPITVIRSKQKEETHAFHFKFYFNWAKNNPFIQDQLEKVWFAGALITTGDRLSKYNYFDKAPILQLVKHFRNGIAHGNKFRIDNPAQLEKYPAHNMDVEGRSTIFVITPDLQGNTVLFDFLYDGDIITLFNCVGFHLSSIAETYKD